MALIALLPPESTSAASWSKMSFDLIVDYYDIDKLVSLANTKIKHLIRGDGEINWLSSLPSAIGMAVQ